MKLRKRDGSIEYEGRSREGAWIEILFGVDGVNLLEGRSREGAWIEINRGAIERQWLTCRSREGAWIEMFFVLISYASTYVAPVRERGLKFEISLSLRTC